MKQEFDNNFSNWGNPYNNSTTESNANGTATPNQNTATPNQYGNAYGNNPTPNQYGNTYGNNPTPNQYGNTYGNNPTPNQYGNAYGNNQMPNQYGNAYGNNQMPNQYGMPNPNNAGQFKTPKKKNTKLIVLIIVLAVLLPIIAIVGFAAATFGLVFGVLNEVKESEEYDLAYEYVVNSDTFDRLNVDESEIKLEGFRTSSNAGGVSHGNKSEFTFDVDGCELVVVCHQDSDDEWFVCDECTFFE